MGLKVRFEEHPKNDYLPPRIIGEAVMYELVSSFEPEKPNSKYWLRCHKCGVSANLGDHEVIINDGIITINPSIQCPNEECNAHYWIKNGEVVN